MSSLDRTSWTLIAPLKDPGSVSEHYVIDTGILTSHKFKMYILLCSLHNNSLFPLSHVCIISFRCAVGWVGQRT